MTMLGRLFGFGSRQPAVLPRVPAGTRVYAVGDVHGRLDLLRRLHQLIHEDAFAAKAPRNVVVYLGDAIDRGPASREVVDCLIDELPPGFTGVHLLGNHEESLLQFLVDPGIGPAWLAYGGRETLLSYGIEPPQSERDLLRVRDDLARLLPQRHLDFFRRLALNHVEGDYFFVHAGVRPGIPLPEQKPPDMLWIRDEFLRSNAEFGKIVVHGHSISEEPDVRRNRIGVDTGAFASGHLTALVLWETEWKFLQT